MWLQVVIAGVLSSQYVAVVVVFDVEVLLSSGIVVLVELMVIKFLARLPGGTPVTQGKSCLEA